MSQIRKFALALVALSVITGATIASAPGIEVLVYGIEVLGPDMVAHTHTTNAPVDAMAFGVWNDGQEDHIVSMTAIAADGTAAVWFPMQSPTNKVVIGFMTDNGIEVLAFTGLGLYEGIWEMD